MFVTDKTLIAVPMDSLQSLMTGLMFHRPDDHIDFLIDCLHKVKDTGTGIVNWNSFVDFKRSAPLPPISSPNKQKSVLDDMGEGMK